LGGEELAPDWVLRQFFPRINTAEDKDRQVQVHALIQLMSYP